ncbi:MAG: hypothetical protein AB4426_25450 [Xenococcaceae cyanobacterium]
MSANRQKQNSRNPVFQAVRSTLLLVFLSAAVFIPFLSNAQQLNEQKFSED